MKSIAKLIIITSLIASCTDNNEKLLSHYNLILSNQTDMAFAILSGERRIMAWCKENAFEGHGLLYILDAMITNKVYKPETVCQKLRMQMLNNLWLPTDLCEEMIQRWEKY